ncbi:MAG: glycosyltransferase family 39 protein [Chloroflexota bacterium]|nr:glycosyltransferase family 39 protein [Dehalococcoidia bacterium]MDW8253757.1 glycosyltransferase family 39 protein [Chloroflexota bacterium]
MTAARRLAPWLVLALFVAIAAWLRFWNAAGWPYGLEYDEGLAGTDALRVLAGEFQIYFREAYREPLYVYLIAPFVAWLGREPLALRLPMMLLGIIMVPLTFMLARDLFDSLGRQRATLIALLAAGLVGTTFWPLVISRTAIPNAALPPFAALTVWLFWRAWSAAPPAWGRFFAAGAALGVTLYCYLPARLLPVVLVGFLAAHAVLAGNEPILRRHWRGMAVAGAVSALIWLPLGLYYLQDPGAFTGRASHVSVFRPGIPEGSVPLALLRTTREAVGAFLWQGDPNWYHNLPGRPIFDPPVAALAVIGAVALLARARRPESLLVLVWAGGMLLPGILSDDNNPNTARLVSMIPVAFLFPAIGFEALLRLVTARAPRLWPAGAAVGVGLVLLVAVGTASTFAFWAEHPEAQAARSGEAFDAVAAMNARAHEPGVFFLLPISNAWPPSRNYQHRSIQFLYRGPAPYVFLRIDDNETPDALTQLCRACRRIYTFVWEKGPHIDADPKGLVPFLLNRAGLDVVGEERRGFDFLGFDLPPAADFRLPPLAPTQCILGGRLEAVAFDVAPTWSGRDLAVIVRWRLLAAGRNDERLSYRAFDSAGRLVGQVDRPLLANDHWGTSRWKAGDEALDAVILPVRPGTLPGPLRIEVVAYHAGPPAAGTLTTVDFPPPRIPYRPEDLELDVTAAYEAGGARLIGYLIASRSAPPGGTVDVTLIWQLLAPEPTLPPVEVIAVRSDDRGQTLLGQSGESRMTLPGRLPVGQLVADYRTVAMLPEASAGSAAIEVRASGRVVAAGGTIEVRPP